MATIWARSNAAAPAIRRRPSYAVAALALVAAAFVLVQLLVNGPRFPLDLDEAVYASQFASGVPRIPYAAHRSAGEGLLAAPVTLVTSSVTALRIYFAVLSGALLFLAYRPWIGLHALPSGLAPVAAAIFAVAWVPLRFGTAVLPNLPVAMAAVAASGLLVRGGLLGRLGLGRLGLFTAMAAMGLLRPTDAAWIAAVLLAAALLVPAWRRRANVAAILAGLAVGGLAWIAEAYARFEDPIARLGAVGDTAGDGGGPSVALRYLRALHGAETCLPTTPACGPVSPGALLLSAGALALLVLGLATARSRPPLLLCAAGAAALAVPYVLLSSWAVPRYLLPAAALAALPAAQGLLTALTTRFTRSPRLTPPFTRSPGLAALPAAGVAALPAVAGVAALLLVHAWLQVSTADRSAEGTRRALAWPVRAAEVLRQNGVGGRAGPCVVVGKYAPQIAYLRGCHAADMHDGLGPRDASGDITPANLRRLAAQGLRTIVVSRRPPPAATWTHLAVPKSARRLYLSPIPPGNP